MTDFRERFWAGLTTTVTFTLDGIPKVDVKTTTGTGVRYTSNRHSIASYYTRGSVVEVNIGKSDQAYAILHGELQLEGSTIPKHLLITWLHWDDAEPIYQSAYPIDDDEVMPSDEVDIIPCTMLSGAACLPGALPDHPDDASDAADMGGIYWKRSHVYISGMSKVMTIAQAVQERPYERHPSQEAETNARRRYAREQRAEPAPEVSPNSKRSRTSAAAAETSWQSTQHVRFPAFRSSTPTAKYVTNQSPFPSPPVALDTKR